MLEHLLEFPYNEDRFIIHVDLDCFYCQVEQLRLQIPHDVPCVVQQWGSLIAVNYAARARGVTRFMHLSEALRVCPDVRAVHTATYALGSVNYEYHSNPSKSTHKVSLEPYRQASRRIHSLIQRVAGSLCIYERAGIDEAYIDVTREVYLRLREDGNNYVPDISQWLTGFGTVLRNSAADDTHNIKHFYLAAEVAHEIRQAVFQELKYRLSAGIASTKPLAKYASSKYKPNQQAVLLDSGVSDFMKDIEVRKLRGYGGDFGKKSHIFTWCADGI